MIMKIALKLLMLTSIKSFAQVNCGKIVVDSVTKSSITFAIIQIDDRIFYTDSLGSFQIKEKEIGTICLVSCMGYESKTIKLNKDCNEKIFLKPKDFILPEITISSKPSKIK